MDNKSNSTRNVLSMALVSTMLFSLSASAIDSVQEAIVTPAYEKNMRTLEMMKKCDTNGDGEVSQAEGEAYFRKMFATLDVNHDGALDKTEWVGAARNVDVVSLATGGYARALSSMDMMAKSDANKDRKVTEDEFLAVHQNLFNKMAAGQPAIDADHWIAAHLPIKG